MDSCRLRGGAFRVCNEEAWSGGREGAQASECASNHRAVRLKMVQMVHFMFVRRILKSFLKLEKIVFLFHHKLPSGYKRAVSRGGIGGSETEGEEVKAVGGSNLNPGLSCFSADSVCGLCPPYLLLRQQKDFPPCVYCTLSERKLIFFHALSTPGTSGNFFPPVPIQP